jgi:hypothetical protein
MKKTKSFHFGETLKVALLAIGFLTFVMLVTYIYWFG